MRTYFFILLLIAFFNSYSDGNKLYYAEILEKSCEYSRAIDEYKKALKTNISKDIESDAYRGLAINSILINDTANAIFYFDKLCKINVDTSFYYSEEFRMNTGYISRINQNIENVYTDVCEYIIYYNPQFVSIIKRYNDIFTEYNTRNFKEINREFYEEYFYRIFYYNMYYLYYNSLFIEYISDYTYRTLSRNPSRISQVFPIGCNKNKKTESFELHWFRMYYNSLIKVFTKEEIENIIDNPTIEYEEIGNKIYFYWNFGKGIKVSWSFKFKKDLDIEKYKEEINNNIKSKKIIEYIKTHLNNNTPFIEEVITKVEK